MFPARSDPCMAYQVALPVGALIRRDMEGTTNTERDDWVKQALKGMLGKYLKGAGRVGT